MNLRASIGLLLFTVCLLPSAARALEFRVLSWSGAIHDLTLNQGPGTENLVLKASEDLLSSPYRVKSERALLLYRAPARPETQEPTLVATLPLPEGMTHAILVLAPTPGNGGGYTGLWIDDSPEARPVNTIAMHNLSARPLALKVADTQLELAPAGRHLHTFRERDRAVIIQAAMFNNGRWERVISGPQPVKPGFRILMILREGRRLSDGSFTPIDRITFYDYLPPESMPGQ